MKNGSCTVPDYIGTPPAIASRAMPACYAWATVEVSAMAYTIDSSVALHAGDRPEQQDYAALLTHPRERGVLLAALADGMGGHSGGALAAQQVIHTCRNNFERFVPSLDTPRELLTTSLAEAHLLIRASRFINEKEPHSTAAVLLVEPGRACWAHCGDSRIYCFRGEQPLSRTRDHSYVERLLASGRITPQEALSHAQRNVLTTSLGGEGEPHIDFGQADELRAGLSFLLCSDGLWAYFADAELGAVVAAHPAREACAILIERARARAQGVGDNVSVVVVKLLAAPSFGPRPGGSAR